MGDQLVVMRFDEAGGPGADLPVDVVMGRLREVFGDNPELDLPIAPGDIVELELAQGRASVDGFVYVGAKGIQRVVIEFTDKAWGEPVHEFRREITRVLDVLAELARETGARFFDSADPDSANMTTQQALGLLAPSNRQYGR